MASISLGGGYYLANQPILPRLVIALDGLEKQGKTHFALTAPGPIAYLNWDIGTQGVIEKFQTEKVIHKSDFGLTILPSENPETVKTKAAVAWDAYIKDFRLALDHAKKGTVRTLVVDTATESWDILRLARLGKLSQVLPHHYIQVNSEYRNLIREVFDTPANLILLHKLKAQWAEQQGGKSYKTGSYDRAGFSDTGFLVQLNATVWRDVESGEFQLSVRDCRQNPAIAGMQLSGPMTGFQTLASLVYPDVDPSVWA